MPVYAYNEYYPQKGKFNLHMIQQKEKINKRMVNTIQL